MSIEIPQEQIEAILGMATTEDVNQFWPTISGELPIDVQDFLTAELGVIAKDFEGFLAKASMRTPESPIEPSQFLFDIESLLRGLSATDKDGVLQCWASFLQFVNID